MTASTRAKVRVGMADAREGAGWLYTHRVDAPRKELHAVDRVMQVAHALGADVSSRHSSSRWESPTSSWAERALAAVPRPRLVLNLGARWLTKRWPPGHFAEVARRAMGEFGAGLVAVGSAGRRALAQELGRHLGRSACWT